MTIHPNLVDEPITLEEFMSDHGDNSFVIETKGERATTPFIVEQSPEDFEKYPEDTKMYFRGRREVETSSGRVECSYISDWIDEGDHSYRILF